MNILHCIVTVNPENGGPIAATTENARALSVLGHRTEIACLDAPDAPWLGEQPCPVHALGGWGRFNCLQTGYSRWIAEHIDRFDCAILHSLWTYACAGAWRGMRKSTIPYFVYTHGLLDPVFKVLYPTRHLKKVLYWRLVQHRIMANARRVLFTCEEEMRLAYDAFNPMRIQGAIAPYCVPEPPPDAAAQRVAFYKQFPQLEGKRLVLFLSRIHHKKGGDLLLHAFAHEARENNIALMMAGPGPQQLIENLQGKANELNIADRVLWAGMLRGDLKWGAFRAADVFALTTHQENFGIAIVEALACGTPVLITDKVRIHREINNDGAAFVDADTEAGAASLLRRWLALAEPERQRMREAALSCFGKRYSSQGAALNFLAVLKEAGVDTSVV